MKIHSIGYLLRRMALYVLKAGDTMTGKLTINPASGQEALDAKKDIVIKSSRKLIFDGD